jgi:hypothetical protein
VLLYKPVPVAWQWLGEHLPATRTVRYQLQRLNDTTPFYTSPVVPDTGTSAFVWPAGAPAGIGYYVNVSQVGSSVQFSSVQFTAITQPVYTFPCPLGVRFQNFTEFNPDYFSSKMYLQRNLVSIRMAPFLPGCPTWSFVAKCLLSHLRRTRPLRLDWSCTRLDSVRS